MNPLDKFKEGRDDMTEKKTEEILSKYSLTYLQNEADLASVRAIIRDVLKTDVQALASFLPSALGGGGSISYDKVILAQNWIIIRQLDRIAGMLETLSAHTDNTEGTQNDLTAPHSGE